MKGLNYMAGKGDIMKPDGKSTASRKVIFCESYGAIVRTLCLATRNRCDCAITVVLLGNHDLFKFFQVINERVFHSAINLIYFEPYPARRAEAKGINKMPHIIPDIIKERRYLKESFDKYFAGLEGCEVFFHSRGFNCYSFYLLKRLSKKNSLVYISYGSPYMGKYTPANIVDLITLIIFKLIYGHEIAMGKYPDQSPHIKGFPYMDDRFMEEKVDRVIEPEEMNDMVKDFDLSEFKIFDAGDYSVIYFDDSLVEAGYITDRDVFKRELTGIFNVLSKYFPETEIARKYHPGYPDDKTVVEIGDVLPDFIPAEFLYNDNVEMYLSLFSFSLANVEKGLAVSLADLITLKGEKTKNQLRDRLIRTSKSKILFPKSLDEFEKILVEAAKKGAGISGKK